MKLYIFWSKVSIWNVNYARAAAFNFDTRTDVLVKFLRQKMSRPQGDSYPKPSGSCRMPQPLEQSGPDVWRLKFLSTGSGGIDNFSLISRLRQHVCIIALLYYRYAWIIPIHYAGTNTPFRVHILGHEVYPLWPPRAIWLHRSVSTLARVMACWYINTNIIQNQQTSCSPLCQTYKPAIITN